MQAPWLLRAAGGRRFARLAVALGVTPALLLFLAVGSAHASGPLGSDGLLTGTLGGVTGSVDPLLGEFDESEPASQGILGGALEPVTEVLDPVIEPVTESVVEPVTELVAPVVEPVVEIVEPVVETVVDPVVEIVDPVVETVVEPVIETVEPVVEIVVEPVVEIVDPVVEIIDPVVDVVDSVVDPVVEIVDPVVETVVDPVVEMVDPVVDAVDSVVEPVVETVDSVVDPVVEIVDPVVDPIVDVVDPIFDPEAPIVEPEPAVPSPVDPAVELPTIVPPADEDRPLANGPDRGPTDEATKPADGSAGDRPRAGGGTVVRPNTPAFPWSGGSAATFPGPIGTLDTGSSSLLLIGWLALLLAVIPPPWARHLLRAVPMSWRPQHFVEPLEPPG